MNSKIVTLPFAFRYSKDGEFREATEITVCEPGYDSRDVYRQMIAFVAEAQKGLLKMFSDQQLEDKAASEGAAASDDEKKDFDAFQTMSLGLSVERFPVFCDYVQRALTSKKALAYVGSNPEDRVACTEEVWRNIAEAGGMGELERVLSEFAGFFFGPKASSKATTTGTVVLSGPPAPATGRSRSSKH